MPVKKSVAPDAKLKQTSIVTAPPPKLDTLKSWSYSVYTSYLKCPMSVMFEKIKRIKIYEPENPNFVKGNFVHKSAELYIGTEGKKEPPVIPELKHVTEQLKKFRGLRAKTEQDWAFTKAWKLSRWNDWDNCWLRIKVDVCAVVDAVLDKKKKVKEPALIHITDWKTGKIYDDHKQQRSLYALGGLQLVELGQLTDGVKDVKIIAEHRYTDTNQSATEEYAMSDLKPLKREWETRIKEMMSDTTYRANPGFHCRWCRFRKSNGGPCPENQ